MLLIFLRLHTIKYHELVNGLLINKEFPRYKFIKMDKINYFEGSLSTSGCYIYKLNFINLKKIIINMN
jgi:hypothetical protein